MYIKYILVFVTISLVERDGPSSSSIYVYIYMYIYIYARLYVYTHIWMCMDVSMFSCNMYDSMQVHTQVNTHHPRWVSPSVQVALGIIVLLTLICSKTNHPQVSTVIHEVHKRSTLRTATRCNISLVMYRQRVLTLICSKFSKVSPTAIQHSTLPCQLYCD